MKFSSFYISSIFVFYLVYINIEVIDSQCIDCLSLGEPCTNSGATPSFGGVVPMCPINSYCPPEFNPVCTLGKQLGEACTKIDCVGDSITCIDGKCSPYRYKGYGEKCCNDIECDAFLDCTGVNKTCVSSYYPRCTNSIGCKIGEICDLGLCKLPLADYEPCERTSQCLPYSFCTLKLFNESIVSKCMPPFTLQIYDSCDISQGYACDLSKNLTCQDNLCLPFVCSGNMDCNDIENIGNICPDTVSFCKCQGDSYVPKSTRGKCIETISTTKIKEVFDDFIQCFNISGCPLLSVLNEYSCIGKKCGNLDFFKFFLNNNYLQNPCEAQTKNNTFPSQTPLRPITKSNDSSSSDYESSTSNSNVGVVYSNYILFLNILLILMI